MFLALLPLTEILCAVDRLLREISSRRCDSSVVEDKEDVSIEVAKDSFLDPLVNFFHLDFSFGGEIDGIVLFLRTGGGGSIRSNETVDTDGLCWDWLATSNGAGSGCNVVSPAPSMEDKFSDRENSVLGVSNLWRKPGDPGRRED